MKTYFLTGASGAIGSALVPILLSETDADVRILLRAQSNEDLVQRLESLFAFWQIARDDLDKRSRVTALRGDATATHFGLDDPTYAALCAECTHIVHSAGNVRMNLPIELARQSAVGSVQQIMELARSCPRLEKLEIVSTVGVGGRMNGEVPEHWIVTPREFHNTYEQSKAEAEEIVHAEFKRGMPITVHRPSMVVGDRVTGRIIHFQVFYHLCQFLAGRRTLGLSPDFGAARLDTVPADYVARLIYWSSTSASTTGRVLHSCSGPELAVGLGPLRDHVRRAFRAAGQRLPPIITLPPRVFGAAILLASLFMPASSRRAVRTLPVFLDYLATDQTFANHQTQALLASAGISVPTPTSYLDRVLGFYLESQSRQGVPG